MLDEPNSNLDDVGEAALRKALLQLKSDGVTVVVITHRPNILSVVDNIMVLSDGVAADFGPAEAIMRKFQQASAKRQLPDRSVS